MKKLTNPLLFTALGGLIVLAIIGTKSLVLDQRVTPQPTIPEATDTPEPTIENTPTEAPTPTTTPRPTKQVVQENSEVNKRLAEIDAELTKLKAEYAECKNGYNTASVTHPNDTTAYMLFNMGCMKNRQERIDILNAERSGLIKN